MYSFSIIASSASFFRSNVKVATLINQDTKETRGPLLSVLFPSYALKHITAIQIPFISSEDRVLWAASRSEFSVKSAYFLAMQDSNNGLFQPSAALSKMWRMGGCSWKREKLYLERDFGLSWEDR